jgi:hypothetical protein
MTISDRAEIKELLARWAYGFDEQVPELMVDCFTKDAVLVINRPDGTVGPIDGRDAIVRNFQASWVGRKQVRRHFITNTWFESEAENSATCLSFLMAVSIADNTPSVFLTGIYRDDVVKEDRWRIKNRTITFDNTFPTVVTLPSDVVPD